MKQNATLHDIRYWILLVPTLVTMFYIIIARPEFMVTRPLLIAAIPIAFWVIYYTWRYIDTKKTAKSV